MRRALNVISFDVPFPPNYGGVIDVFYKLKWLKENNVAIILHCFTYGREPSLKLEELCEKVHYYERKMGLMMNLSQVPFTVVSRRNEELAQNLLTNNYPILFEVLHTCALMDDVRFKDRMKIYRHSNIEHHYYRELAKSEKQISKKLYLRLESIKLQRFEKVLEHASLILAVNQRDRNYFEKKFSKVKSVFLPSFHPYDEVDTRIGTGQYVLYHGNLGISENYESAVWLINNVFSHVIYDVVIAGLNPPEFLKRHAAKYRHIKIIENPSAEKMDELIAGAEVHCLHTHQTTGLKLKLLHVLFRGRFIVTNNDMISGTGLRANSGLLVADSANEFVSNITRVFNTPFEESHANERREIVKPFRNQVNAATLVGLLFSE